MDGADGDTRLGTVSNLSQLANLTWLFLSLPGVCLNEAVINMNFVL